MRSMAISFVMTGQVADIYEGIPTIRACLTSDVWIIEPEAQAREEFVPRLCVGLTASFLIVGAGNGRVAPEPAHGVGEDGAAVVAVVFAGAPDGFVIVA